MQIKKYPESDKLSFVIKKIEHRIKYLNHLKSSIKKFGVKNYEKELTELKIFKKLTSEPLMEKEASVYFEKHTLKSIEIIIDVCLNEYKKFSIKRGDIFQMKLRRKVTELRNIIINLMVEHLSLNYTEISELPLL